jgi:ketosteroid isomerase-like protein
MSQENVDVVQRALDAYTNRDVEVLRVYRGIDEAMRFYAGYFEAFEEIVIKPDRLIEAGDSVVVPNVAHQRGRDGIEVSARSTLVFTLRSRRITRICLYQDTEQALKAVALGERA